MNQILVNKKVYVTPKLKRKRMFYKIQFVLSIVAVIILTSYCIYTEYTQRKGESESQEIMDNMGDLTVAENDILVVALNDNATELKEPPKILDEFNKVYTTDKGTEYKIDAILNIPAIDIKYPVISTSSDELLKISLNKFWGGEPNAIGNYCIVGHNYDGKDIFFGKLHKLQSGDTVEMIDKTGKKLTYVVYDKYIVQPTDVACTSQLTNGRVEATLITCADGGRTRLIVKCRVVE